jgi:peptide-methionine (S)-S-oxide reductase
LKQSGAVLRIFGNPGGIAMIGKLSAALVFGLALGGATAQAAEPEVAIFAGGCFWCVESDFDHVNGVISTVSGYIGGTNDNPTYQDHTAANHREAVRIEYDPRR